MIDHSYLKARQLEQSETAAAIMGVMLESNLIEGAPFVALKLSHVNSSRFSLFIGRQNIPLSGPSGLTYGQSVTDGINHFTILDTNAVILTWRLAACVSWADTVPVLDRLRDGVRARRAAIARRRAPLFSTGALNAGSGKENGQKAEGTA